MKIEVSKQPRVKKFQGSERYSLDYIDRGHLEVPEKDEIVHRHFDINLFLSRAV